MGRGLATLDCEPVGRLLWFRFVTYIGVFVLKRRLCRAARYAVFSDETGRGGAGYFLSRVRKFAALAYNLDMVGVGGSIPLAPTIRIMPSILGRLPE